jgi:alpha-D-xyloside xylohydrolase
MRGLAMDFAADPKALDVRDQYLFGRSFLVAPVTAHKARSRAVYLPSGVDWYDFNSGRKLAGGQSVEAAAPLNRLPLYVRAGSIVPVGGAIQYTLEAPAAPITLFVFTGADGSFELYEDDGVSYGYEKGEFSRIPIRFDAAKGALTIGARTGSYPGMPEERKFHVRWIRDGGKAPADLDAEVSTTVDYKGAELTVTQ